MANARLPERASLEYLKKLAKERLQELRRRDPQAQLAAALLEIARDYGFPSWRALKAELERRRAPIRDAFFHACATGDNNVLRGLLGDDRNLVSERTRKGSTCLHLAVRHPEALRFLIENGADPNARDIEDNAGPLHFAAANGEIESVRTLLDLGANVHGSGDLHNSEVIGWAAKPGNEPVINLLQERGARHHIFSAMALGDRNLVQKLVEENPECLARRRSRFESGQTPVHAALAPPDGLGFIAGKPDYEMLQLLIELGADVEAPDGKGRTPLAVAMLRGDIEAMSLLKAAGAQEPAESLETDRIADLATVTQSIRKSSPMFAVRDMRQTVNWYESLGFTLEDSFEDGEELVFARVSLGQAEFTLGPGGNPGPRDVTLWFFTDQVGQLYELLRDRQMRNAQASLSGSPQDTAVRFKEDLYSPFYGGQQFSIEDINGMTLIFWQSK